MDIDSAPDDRSAVANEQVPERITIRPPDYEVREKGVRLLDSEVIQKHFSTLIVGRPESGKSHLLYEYVTNP